MFTEKGKISLSDSRYAVVVNVSLAGKESYDTLHVREYSSDGYPTKRGVVLNGSRWTILKSSFPAIVDMFDIYRRGIIGKPKFHAHLGNGIYATMDKYPVLHLRKYFKPNNEPGNTDEPLPTKIGITLRSGEFTRLMEMVPAIELFSEELKCATACYDSYDHLNQMGFLACRECSPFHIAL